MQKFSFTTDSGNKVIRHNLKPEMLIQIIQNDEEEYDVWEDCYELFEFRGNKFVIKWYADEDELNEVEDYNHIRSILRRAWQWYKSQVFIDAKTYEPGPMENERYKLEATKDGKGWVCADKQNLYVIVWEGKRFDDTQKVTLLEDFNQENIMYLSRWGREMGEWLVKCHKDKI